MTSTWTKRARLAAPVLAAYWIALGVATHLPGESVSIPAPWDKLIHASGYGLLAFLAAFVWRGRTRTGLTSYVYLWSILAVYGALDETTQPIFGRTCDLYDWVADVSGVLAGILVHAAWTRVASKSAPSVSQEK